MLKPCAEPGCPILGTQTRCPTHTRTRDSARGTRQQRGYTTHHDKERANWQRQIDTGQAIHCATCGRKLAGREWDLGHTTDRTGWIGPQCIPCNRGHHHPSLT